MYADENLAVARRAVDAFNTDDWDAVDHLFAPAYVDHDRSRAGLPPGPEGIRMAWGAVRAAFPDMRVTIEDEVAEGDQVAVRAVARGTHRGDLLGLPPTGRTVELHLMDITRIVDGQMVERWGVADMLGLMRQLGAIPSPAGT